MGKPAVAFLLLGVTLAACASPEPEPIPEPMPIPQPLPPPPPPPSSEYPVAYVPVGRIVATGTPFVPEGGGFAVVLLKRGTAARNGQACAAMVRSMGMRQGPVDGRPIVNDGFLVYQRPVYWPVTRPTNVNCAQMLQTYDFDRAAANLQRVPNWQGLGQGPFVVVRKANGTQAGLFDFSTVAGVDFPSQFSAVVNYMSQGANVWTPGFYHPATFRQRLRYYVIERAGGATVVVARLVNLSGGAGG